jgi:hypothetical protein
MPHSRHRSDTPATDGYAPIFETIVGPDWSRHYVVDEAMSGTLRALKAALTK